MTTKKHAGAKAMTFTHWGFWSGGYVVSNSMWSRKDVRHLVKERPGRRPVRVTFTLDKSSKRKGGA